MVTYRIATKDDYTEINNFHNRIKGIGRTIEEFNWEFENGPFGPSLYIIAEDNNKIIGTNCVIPIEFVLSNGETISTGKSEDTLVDPAYRGQKIFYKIYEVLFEESEKKGINVIWGFTSAYKPFSNLGFEIPYEHIQAVSVNRILASYRYLSKLNIKNGIADKVKILGLCCLAKLKNLKLSGGSINGSYQIKAEQNLTTGFEELIVKNLSENLNQFAIRQTPAYQQWRVYDNPNYDESYSFGIYQNEKLVGVILYNKNKNNIVFLNQVIFDVSVPSNERAKILRRTTKLMFKNGIALIRGWQFTHNDFSLNELNVLTKSGFFIVRRGVGLVWKNLGDSKLQANNFVISRLATQGVD